MQIIIEIMLFKKDVENFKKLEKKENANFKIIEIEKKTQVYITKLKINDLSAFLEFLSDFVVL